MKKGSLSGSGESKEIGIKPRMRLRRRPLQKTRYLTSGMIQGFLEKDH